MIVAPVSHAKIEEAQALAATARGAGGFGSTGVKPGKKSKPVRAGGKAGKVRTK